MGHWATYRKRGRVPAPPTLIPAPPAPLFAVVEGNMIQTSTASADDGGMVRLYQSADEGENWTLAGEETWDSPMDWGPAADYVSLWVRCTEVGNGSTYLGESPPSAILEL